MTPLIVVLGVDLKDIPRSVKREFNQAMKVHMKEVGEYWFKKYRPKHFGRGGHSRYDYAKRDEKYLKRKRKAVGPRPDLVFSGKTSRYTAYGERITSTSRMARVKMDLPNRKVKRQQQKQTVRELTTVIASEVVDMQKFLLQKLTQTLNTLLEGK